MNVSTLRHFIKNHNNLLFTTNMLKYYVIIFLTRFINILFLSGTDRKLVNMTLMQ
jgi:hypothetical protein